MRVWTWLVALVLALAVPASAAPVGDEPSLVGIWYGIGEPDDPDIAYLDAYHADGTYEAAFRKCQYGEEVWRQTASGKWTYKDGVLQMISETVDGKPAVYDSSYTIELLTETEFRARLHEPIYLFIERRVDKFEFPPCYLGA